MIKNETMLQQSNKIMVHATSIDKLADLLTTKFLSNPSLAIIDPNEKISNESDRTELDVVSSEFGQVVLIANPNHVLNKHKADIYPCDSASATMPDINKGYFNPHNKSLEFDSLSHTMMGTIKQWFHQKFDSENDTKFIDFYFKYHKTRSDESGNFMFIHPHFERLYFILKNQDILLDILEQYQLKNNQFHNGYKLVDIQFEQSIFNDAFMYGLETQFKKIIDAEFKQNIKQDKTNNDEIKTELDMQQSSEIKMYAIIWAALHSSHFYPYIQHLFNHHAGNKQDNTNAHANAVNFSQIEFEMQEKMYKDGLIKYHVSLNNDWEIEFPEYMELTKENVQTYFKNINGEHTTRLSEYGMHEEITNWENYQIIAAINPIIQLDDLTNELYRLNRKELEQFSHQNEFQLTLKNENQIKLFNQHKSNIDEIFKNCHEDTYLDEFEEITQYFTDYFPDAQYELEYLIIPSIVALSNQTLDLDHERFESTIELLEDAVNELKQNLYSVAVSGANADEMNAALEALSYFSYKIGYETFVPFYEFKMKECVDIDNKNFSHVLLPLSTLHQENNIQPLQYAINKFNELGIKTIFYEKNTFDENGNIKVSYYDKNEAIQELIQNNEIGLVNNFELDKAKLKAKQELKTEHEQEDELKQKTNKKRKLR